MQDAHHANRTALLAVNNDVFANQIAPVCIGQIVSAMPERRITRDGLQRFINLAAIDVKLLLPPGFTRVAQNVDEVLPGLSGKFYYRITV